MKQNLGKIDRVLRFALAFWWLGPLAPAPTAGWMNWLMIIIGWIALVESFLGWCFFHQWFKINNKSQ